MNLLRTYLYSCIAIFGISTPAHAYTVDFYDVTDVLNMGLLANEQDGTINYLSIFAAQRDTVGQLRAKTQITFNFTFNGGLNDSAYNILSGSYGYTDYAGDSYQGLASSERFIDPISPISEDIATGTVNSVSDTALLFATSNLIKGETTAELTVSNFSDGIADFSNIMRILANNPIIASARYTVVSISTVPLPAALPLFAALVGGLFGVSRIRRQKTSNA